MKDSIPSLPTEAKATSETHTCFFTEHLALGREEIKQTKVIVCTSSSRSNDDASPWTGSHPWMVSGASVHPGKEESQRSHWGGPMPEPADTACKETTHKSGASWLSEGTCPIPWPATRCIQGHQERGGMAFLEVKTVALSEQKHVSRSIPKGHPRLWLASCFRDNCTSRLLCELRPAILKVGS